MDQMLLHSLLGMKHNQFSLMDVAPFTSGMKHNQFDLMIFHQKLCVLFSHKKA